MLQPWGILSLYAKDFLLIDTSQDCTIYCVSPSLIIPPKVHHHTFTRIKFYLLLLCLFHLQRNIFLEPKHPSTLSTTPQIWKLTDHASYIPMQIINVSDKTARNSTLISVVHHWSKASNLRSNTPSSTVTYCQAYVGLSLAT